MVVNIIHRKTDNIVAKKQKDKKINNGRQKNEQYREIGNIGHRTIINVW